MQKTLARDLLSGLVISFVALPLSIGIALAAEVPVSAGVLAAVLAGIVGSLVSGVQIGINGPGAGLIVAVATATTTLGEGDTLLGFKRTLACILVVGLLQIITGLLKLGKYAKLCPNAVVKGMLSAIGAIIIVKQIPVFLGVNLTDHSMGYFFSHFGEIVSSLNPLITSIGLCSIIVLIIWRVLPRRLSSFFPGTLATIILGIIATNFLSLGTSNSISFFGNSFIVGEEFLVKIPGTIKGLFIFPVFDRLFTLQSLIGILSIYVIASLESFLCAFAVEKLDPQKRKSNLNKDIIGKGLVNISCGLLGGFPVILAIVRTTANIQSGAKTIKSNFFHGCFILLFIVFFSGIINQVPLAVLAAILILVGYSLINPANFMEMWREGKESFLLFSLTLVLTVMINLLVGILAGVILKFILDTFRGRMKSQTS